MPVEPRWLPLTLHDVGTWHEDAHDELEQLVVAARRAANANGLAEELRAAAGQEPVEVVVRRIELLLLERDYTWAPVAHVDLGR